MKVVRHEKHRGKYIGQKTGAEGDYLATTKTEEPDPGKPAGGTGSTNPRCRVCPLHQPGFSLDNPVDPSMFDPEVINELLKSELFKDSDCGCDTTVIVIGNVLIINRNATCHSTSS
ncbi:MAG: hypothetical protein ACOX4Q_13810 [Syntrophomonadales bacterium]